jgi:hypothetical protein
MTSSLLDFLRPVLVPVNALIVCDCETIIPRFWRLSILIRALYLRYFTVSLTAALIEAGKATMMILFNAKTLSMPQGHFIVYLVLLRFSMMPLTFQRRKAYNFDRHRGYRDVRLRFKTLQKRVM